MLFDGAANSTLLAVMEFIGYWPSWPGKEEVVKEEVVYFDDDYDDKYE